FGLYEYRDRENDGISGGQKTTFQQDDPFYGGKLDLNVTSNHRLEFTYFEDSTDVIGDASDFASGSFVGESFDARGGENYTGRYTGIFGDSFVLAAQYGVNEFARTSQGSTDANPAIIDSRQGGLVFLGNWANFTVTGADDQRDMYRLDADYFLTEHSLRAGGSRDENFSFNEQTYTGGIYWRYFIGDGGFGEVPGSELVRERVFENGGSFDTINEAYYVQDNWEVNERLQINAGLRLESYDNQNANGESFIEVENQYGPRVGAIYDPSGDGRSKIYGNYGRYFLPIAANTNIRLAGAEFFTEDWYLLNGLNADDTPIIGDLLESRVFSNGTIPDVRETTSEEIDPFFQDEFVIGYERLVSDNWSVGVRGVYRDVGDIIEDITINQAVATQLGVTTDDLAGVGLGNHYVLVNPGESIVTFWDVTDASGALGPDGTPDRFELSEAELGYPDPERQYYAAEFTFNRRFAGNWSLQGSYTWAHSYGNYEGWVRSDNGQDDAGITTLYDFPGLLDGANGNLPNDRRHNVKLFGAYRFDMGLLVGLNTSFRSGRPLNSFGVHPTDEGAASYGAESFFTDGVLTPRGSGGETDDVFRMDLTARYDFDIGPTDLSLRFDVFNVFDDDTAIELVETAEEESGAPDPLFLTPTQFVRPRTVRLGFELTF
ncbi:MAG: TonB-dependent receptor, partial [Acidobacteriota bacterium]